MMTAYFLISLDFCIKEVGLENTETKRTFIEEGLKYGNLGRDGFEREIKNLVSLEKGLYRKSSLSETQIRKALDEGLSQQQFGILGESLSSTEIVNDFFGMARRFESHGFALDIPVPDKLSPKEKSMLALLADFWAIDRKTFFT